MEQKEYVTPTIDIVEIKAEDVIVTSNALVPDWKNKSGFDFIDFGDLENV